MRFGRHSTVKQILDDPQARAVLLKHVPAVEKHPDLDQALFMTIDEAASYPESDISKEQYEAIIRDLSKIGEGE